MNEEQLNRILKADQEAQRNYELALKNTELIPIQAEMRAKSLLEMARQNAESEAKAILDHARNDLVDQGNNELADEELRKMELSAANNLDKAVEFVLGKLVRASKAEWL